MRHLSRWCVLLSVCLSVFVLTKIIQAQEKKKEASSQGSSQQKVIHDTLRDVINHGADLYNNGDWNGCYRLWEGALMTLRPLLSQHAELQQTIDTALVNARQDPFLYRRAWVLRTALDQVRSDLKGDGKGGKAKPKATAGSTGTKKTGDRENTTAPRTKNDTLWERLGSEAGVTRIVDDFVNLASKNPKVDFFRHAKYKTSAEAVVKMKREIIEQISQATGGPLSYKGPDMKQIHKDMGITDAQFDAAAADLKKALEKNHVADSDVRTILDAVNSYRKDVVHPKQNPEKKSDGKQPGSATEVSGRVTYKGKPLPGGTIVLVGQKEGERHKANLDDDGSFKLPSIPPGDYGVIIETKRAQPPRGAKVGKEAKGYVMIPAKYAEAATTPLKAQIRASKEVLNLDLSD